MKKSTLFSALCCAATTAVIGQPNLGAGSATLIPGDQFTYTNGDYPQPGAGGTGQVWDYSATALSAPNQATYVTPAASGMSGSYPNATVALDGGSGNYVFYRGTATTFEEDGSNLSGVAVTCSDRLTVMQYPFAYGNTFTDGLACAAVYNGTNWTQTGTITVTADGWGDVITAAGTVSNVLRVHIVRELTDNQYTPPSIYTNDGHYFYKPGVHSPVVILDNTVSTFFGIVVADSSMGALDATSIGMEEALNHAIGVDVQPNPATDQVQIVFGTDAGPLTIDLLDVTGKAVRTLSIRTQVAGVQRQNMELSGLPAGVYLVRIMDAQGAMGVKRVVKN